MYKKLFQILLILISVQSLNAEPNYELRARDFYFANNELNFNIFISNKGTEPFLLTGAQMYLLLDSNWITQATAELSEPLFTNSSINVFGNRLRIIEVLPSSYYEINGPVLLGRVTLRGNFNGTPVPLSWMNPPSVFHTKFFVFINKLVTEITNPESHFVDWGLTGLTNNTQEYNFYLKQNYPNPFNPVTKITFSVASKDFVTLKIYNILGKEVATLINGSIDAGMHEIDFNASELSSGIYFYRLTGSKFSETRKMEILK